MSAGAMRSIYVHAADAISLSEYAVCILSQIFHTAGPVYAYIWYLIAAQSNAEL